MLVFSLKMIRNQDKMASTWTMRRNGLGKRGNVFFAGAEPHLEIYSILHFNSTAVQTELQKM